MTIENTVKWRFKGSLSTVPDFVERTVFPTVFLIQYSPVNEKVRFCSQLSIFRLWDFRPGFLIFVTTNMLWQSLLLEHICRLLQYEIERSQRT